MKKWILIISILVLMLSGCSKQSAEVPQMPQVEFDNTGKRMVLYCGNKSFPLSFSVDGVQQIENDTYWFYELNNLYETNKDALYYTYNFKKAELSGSKSYDKAIKEKCFATDGEWPLFLSPVHVEYTSSNQTMVDEKLLKLTRENLSANNIVDEKALITDTWSSDMDGDGKHELLFKACNSEDESSNKQYCFLAYLKEEECQILYSRVAEKEGGMPENITPRICDLNGDEKWELLLYKKHDYESFTIYNFEGGNFTKGYEIIF